MSLCFKLHTFGETESPNYVYLLVMGRKHYEGGISVFATRDPNCGCRNSGVQKGYFHSTIVIAKLRMGWCSSRQSKALFGLTDDTAVDFFGLLLGVRCGDPDWSMPTHGTFSFAPMPPEKKPKQRKKWIQFDKEAEERPSSLGVFEKKMFKPEPGSQNVTSQGTKELI